MASLDILAGVIIIMLLVIILAGVIRLKNGLAETLASLEEILREIRGINRNVYGYTKKTSDILGYRLSPDTGNNLREIISRFDDVLREMSEAPRTELIETLKVQVKLLREMNEKLSAIGYNTDKRLRLEDDPF